MGQGGGDQRRAVAGTVPGHAAGEVALGGARDRVVENPLAAMGQPTRYPRIGSSESIVGFHRFSQFLPGPTMKASSSLTGPAGSSAP
jgi:hypothetical protein